MQFYTIRTPKRNPILNNSFTHLKQSPRMNRLWKNHVNPSYNYKKRVDKKPYHFIVNMGEVHELCSKIDVSYLRVCKLEGLRFKKKNEKRRVR